MFYFKGTVVQVIERGSTSYNFRVDVSAPSEFESEIVYLADYTGTRILEEDDIEFIGKADGLYRYEAIFGNQVTIPRLKTVQLRLVEN